MKNTAKIWVVGRCLVAVVQLARKVVQLTGGSKMVTKFVDAANNGTISPEHLTLLADMTEDTRVGSTFTLNIDLLPATLTRYVRYFSRMIAYTMRVVQMDLVSLMGHAYSDDQLESQYTLIDAAQRYGAYTSAMDRGEVDIAD